ncbi:MAG: rifampicin phosphotransferase, partial [Actinomycetota bacterium]|nr:rifampicin phosphotransferase [Actinomycetota bacterium]
MAEKLWFLDDEPSTRFPQYCRGNVGEVVPNVTTPLAASVLTNAFRHAFSALFTESGAFSTAELREDSAAGGVFGGYLYINLSFARVFARRMPGARLGDIDQQLLGSFDAPPYRAQHGDRSVRRSLRLVAGLPATILRRKPLDLDATRRATMAWRRDLPAVPTDDELVSIVATYDERFEPLIRGLVEVTLGAALPTSLLERLSRRAELAEPGLLVRALSGLGTIETAAPAMALWWLGRRARASDAITRELDAGGEDLLDRLRRSTTPDVVAFVSDFDAFLSEHGHRGPNEVELASETWSTAPGAALAAVDRLRLAPESTDPVAAGARLADEREAAAKRLRSRTPLPARPLVGRLLRAAARGAARREQAKGTIVLDIDGVRRLLFARADVLVAEGSLPDRRSMFMVTVDELPTLLRDPASLAETIAARRAWYEELDSRIPPFSFEGALPPLETWPRRDGRHGVDVARPGDVLTGIGVASGSATGTVRVVTDPSDPRGIGPGDVLVAPITDPAWTPLFLAASAVVVDVGALQSH